jgi:hypothetical protein
VGIQDCTCNFVLPVPVCAPKPPSLRANENPGWVAPEARRLWGQIQSSPAFHVGQNDPSQSFAKRPPCLPSHFNNVMPHASLYNRRGKHRECYSMRAWNPHPIIATFSSPLRRAWKGVTQASGASQALTCHFNQCLVSYS